MNPSPERKGRGCFFYGCLTLVIVILVGTVGTVLGVRHFVNKAVLQYTDAQPADLPKSDITPAEAAEVKTRFSTFQEGVKSGKATPSLVLSGRELNGLLASNPDLSKLKDKIYLSIDKDTLKGEVSIPLPEIGLGRYPGRYLNGSATLKASLENGVLIVTLQSLSVKGVAIPSQALTQLRAQNLAQDMYKDPRTAEWMRRLESITVKDGRIEIKAREKDQQPPQQPAAESTSTNAAPTAASSTF